jgi:uncharacterized protein
MVLKTFGWSFALTAAALVGAAVLGGAEAALLVAVLCVLEISLSFDNAVLNATVLQRMSAFWQRMFLTVGMVIAVFGMRIVFPLLLVCVTADVGPVEVVRLALAAGPPGQPGTYAYLLHEAHPAIAAFGGMFLLMIFLGFVFEDRALTWLSWLERPLQVAGRLEQMPVVVGLTVLLVAAQLVEPRTTVLISGALGLLTYIVVNGLSELFENTAEPGESKAGIHGDAASVEASMRLREVAGRAGFFLFLYLEVLDASFSFDGVVGAFAVTPDIFLIAVGLGVGALYIRSMTVFLVRKGTLQQYVFLEHGAHWAIGALAVILLVSIAHEVPELVTGLIGVAFIGLALLSSIVFNKRGGLAAAAENRREAVTTR